MIGQALLHYTVLERIGEGGMGVVYKARDTRLDRLVALKVLPEDRLGNDDARRRFVQEARSASPAAGGASRRLTDHPGNDIGASWSRDGKTIYLLSNRGGGGPTIWSMPAAGGAAWQLSKTVSAIPPPADSPDGQWVYFRSPGGISRVRPDGTDEAVVVKDRATGLNPTTRGLFYVSPAVDLQSALLRLVPLAGGPARDVGTIPFTVMGGLSFTADLTRMLYARCDQCAADIMLVENFR